ncbi:MAG TPA: aldo/keto reductase [Gemmatimonadales bacterium]|nr:aldo/keto reductase [Gemmatimonadales bacterium]
MHTGARRTLGPPPHFGSGPATLGFGAWAVGGAGWGSAGDRSGREATVRRAVERGVTFFDTAPSYGDGESERLLGRVLKPVRDRIVIATKVGPRDDPRASLEASLRRLDTDYVDLLQLHEALGDWERALDGLSRLQAEGLARAVGIANATHLQLRRAMEIAPVASYQGPYNLFDRDVELRELPLARERGLAFLAYRPLASGLLSGKLEAPPEFAPGDHRRGIYWFQGPEFARRRGVIERLEPVARRLDLTLSALALGWVLARPGVAVVLAGARTPEQVDQNLEAARRPLPEDLVRQIDAMVAAAFRLPAADAGLRRAAAEWGERERFIVERLDGARTAEEIAAEWTDRGDIPMIAAQVKVFTDRLRAGV